MSANIETYYSEFMQNVYAKAGAEENFHETVFTEMLCDYLVEQGIVEHYQYVGYKKNNRGIRVDAWYYNEETEALTLFITDFAAANEPKSLTLTNTEKLFKRAETFFVESLKPSFCKSLEECAPGYELALEINQRQASISKIQFILLSNSILSERITDISMKGIEKYSCTYDIWEISRLFNIESSGKSKEDVIIDFTKLHSSGIPCLRAFTENSYESYLLVLPGHLVAELYEKYGERLLEQNVRTFLQFRGKVNKGIRNTIMNEPHMFFSYNNGLTATAEDIVSNEAKDRIMSIRNLQVVNGGQTTASIFTAMKKHKAELQSVHVQVKLTIIPPDKVETVVPKISEYANTQNKVNAADFFSNHPFHLRMEDISRRLLAPSQDGSIKETYWYYERTRGQYANAMANLTPSEKKRFLIQNPRDQMFTKTDLAKFENSWNMLPHEVSFGAQKNFARYANIIGQEWDRKDKEFNELYYQQLIAKAILFRYLDQNIMKQGWYGGYKANIITYSIAKLSYELTNNKLNLDLLKIWKKQDLSTKLKDVLIGIAEKVNISIQKTPSTITNVTEWCKREGCWDDVKSIKIKIADELKSDCVGQEEITYLKKDAKKTQDIVNGINAQTYVYEKGTAYWIALEVWNQQNKFIRLEKEVGILETACNPNKILSDKQSRILIDVETRAKEEGFFVADK